MLKWILIFLMLIPSVGLSQYAKEEAGAADSMGIDTNGDGTIDNYLYSTVAGAFHIKKGSNITLTVAGDTVTVGGPGAGGTADSLGVDTDGDGTVDNYLYSTTSMFAMIRESTGVILTVDTDTLYIEATLGTSIEYGEITATTSANWATVVSDETGTGKWVFGTSPVFKTDITSPLVIGGTETTSDLSFQTTTGVGATGADMHFLVGNNGGTEAMTILNNGNVGIGINSPSSIFHIKADVPGTVGSHPAGQLIIQNPINSVFGCAVITGYESDAVGNPDQQLWYLGSSSSSNSNIIFLNRRNSKLELGTNGVSRMTIDGGGYVGIGTASPPERLSVVGNIATGDTAAGDVDVFHYFSIDGSWVTEYLKWDDGVGEFQLSDDLEVGGFSIGGKTETGNKHWTFNIVDPDAVYAIDHEICIIPQTEAALTVTRLDVTLDADPTTELEYSLKFADAFIGFTNATVIDDTATVAGITTVYTITGDATVPANKCVYLSFDADPDDNITQVSVNVTWDYD